MGNMHVVLLRKNLTKTGSDRQESWLSSNYTRWVAFGHFDDIYTRTISGEHETVLSMMQEDKAAIRARNSEHLYYYPLYLLPDRSFSPEPDCGRFIAIVRIHFNQSLKLTGLFQQLQEKILSKIRDEKLCCCVCYATEFSDMVLELRSEKLLPLLKYTLNLRNNHSDIIGKTYTYFGMNARLITGEMQIPDSDSEKIPMFTIKLSEYEQAQEQEQEQGQEQGQGQEQIKQQIQLIKEKLKIESDDSIYRMNGIDDLLLICKDCQTKDVVSLYQDWYKNKSGASTRLEIKFREAEDDPSQNASGTSKEKSSPDEDLSKMCRSLPRLCQDISSAISQAGNHLASYSNWFPAILEITNSLVRMSKTPVLDEIVYLIVPGIHAFLKNIRHYLSTEPIYRNHRFYDFAENCSYYIEQLMRVEGQLSHDPEIRPVIWDIPVFMLEYTIAFLNSVSRALRKPDRGAVQPTTFLLVPCPCERASSTELFPATRVLPGLVHIKIPEQLLYDPDELFSTLCHEISHYVGEKCRERELRIQAYAHASAFLLADCVFDCIEKYTFPLFLKDALLSLIREKLESEQLPTIKNMSGIVYEETRSSFMHKNSMNHIYRAYIDWAAKQKDDVFCIPFLGDSELNYRIQAFFQSSLNDLNILFREIYADICMLYILNFPTEKYIKSLLQELAEYPKESKVIEIFAIRIYIALTAMQREISYNQDQYLEIWLAIQSTINEIDQEIESRSSASRRTLPSNAIYALLEYAKACYKTLKLSVHTGALQKVQQMHHLLLSEEFEYAKIFEKIQSSRQVMLGKKKKSTDEQQKTETAPGKGADATAQA